jgi:hypothetical protein
MNAPTRAPTTFVALTPALRQMIENVVEDLLLILDELDGDENLEPYLGGFDGNADDREAGDVLDEPHDDGREEDEPDLGSPAGGTENQEHWAQGRDHFGADSDEPFLGTPIACDHDQRAWGASGEAGEADTAILGDEPC